MPIYEYRCESCDHRFEELILGSETPSCPTCEGSELERLFSSFAVGSSDAGAAAGPADFGSCGTCGDPRGPGACSLDGNGPTP